jgi:predicted transposase YbfD/YdcC
MANYTVELRTICEQITGHDKMQGYSQIETIIEKAAPKIFDFSFPLWNEDYRLPLEIKILRHFYTREISEETVALWKLRLDQRMNEIMPYYNQLYQLELDKIYVFNDTDYYRKQDRTTDDTEDNKTNATAVGVTKDTTENTGTAKGQVTVNATDDNLKYDLYSDTPQGALNGVDSETYLTNARKTTVNDKQNSVTDSTSTTTSDTEYNSNTKNDTDVTENKVAKTVDDFLEHVAGKIGGGTYLDQFGKLKENILNIDQMLLDDLNILFFGLWD